MIKLLNHYNNLNNFSFVIILIYYQNYNLIYIYLLNHLLKCMAIHKINRYLMHYLYNILKI